MIKASIAKKESQDTSSDTQECLQITKAKALKILSLESGMKVCPYTIQDKAVEIN